MEAAIELGLTVVKFFPAEANGGVKSIKAMAAPYTQLRFMPTGGINEKNLLDYLAFPKIIACGGSFMVSEDLLKAGNYAAITELTRGAVRLMLGFELAHIGINAENEEEAKKGAAMFETLFGFAAKEGNSSVFAGTAVELMNRYEARADREGDDKARVIVTPTIRPLLLRPTLKPALLQIGRAHV